MQYVQVVVTVSGPVQVNDLDRSPLGYHQSDSQVSVTESPGGNLLPVSGVDAVT